MGKVGWKRLPVLILLAAALLAIFAALQVLRSRSSSVTQDGSLPATPAIDRAISGVKMATPVAPGRSETNGELIFRTYAKSRVRMMFNDPATTTLKYWSAASADDTEHGVPRIACGLVDTGPESRRTGDKFYLLFWDGKTERFCHEDAFRKACADITASPLFADCVARMRAPQNSGDTRLIGDLKEDAAYQRTMEEGRRLVDKSIPQMAQEARDQEAAATRDAEERRRKVAEAEAAHVADQQCRALFQEQMPYLEPTRDPPGGGRNQGGSYTYRYIVRLTDSFRAEPVGVVECSLLGVGLYGKLRKIAM